MFRAITINASNSPFFEDLLEYEFPKKFMILAFNCYSGQSDPVQHLHQYQDKLLNHSRNNFILCRVFPSRLKGVPSNWLYSLRPRSIHSFRYLTRLFLAHYSSR